MSGRVEGKVAFITGAARGQGRSHAIRLASRRLATRRTRRRRPRRAARPAGLRRRAPPGPGARWRRRSRAGRTSPGSAPARPPGRRNIRSTQDSSLRAGRGPSGPRSAPRTPRRSAHRPRWHPRASLPVHHAARRSASARLVDGEPGPVIRAGLASSLRPTRSRNQGDACSPCPARPSHIRSGREQGEAMEPPSPATMPSAATSWRHTAGACLSSSGWACPGHWPRSTPTASTGISSPGWCSAAARRGSPRASLADVSRDDTPRCWQPESMWPWRRHDSACASRPRAQPIRTRSHTSWPGFGHH